MADGSIPAAEPHTFYAPNVVEHYVYGLNNGTYTCVHTHILTKHTQMKPERIFSEPLK